MNHPSNHPWDEFLEARTKCIHWMNERQNYDDEKIARTLSMDETQVYFIRTHPSNNITSKNPSLKVPKAQESRDYNAKELEDLKKEFSKFKMGALADIFSYKTKMEKNIEELVEERKSYINDIEISFERHFNEMKSRNEEPRDYPAGNQHQDLWYDFPCIPKDDSTILMKMWNRDTPPWTGYHDGENFIAYETRLPIRVSHWRYVSSKGDEDNWLDIIYHAPIEDKTILMKHSAFDIPPWTGYFEEGHYYAYETRLPIWVTHWRYVE